MMMEPVLDLSRQEDSLDLLFEMNLVEVVGHPVVIEVLDFLNEGKYSVTTSPMGLS